MNILSRIAGVPFEDDSIIFKIDTLRHFNDFHYVYGFWKFRGSWRWNKLGCIEEDSKRLKTIQRDADIYLDKCQSLFLQGRSNRFVREVAIRDLIQQGVLK